MQRMNHLEIYRLLQKSNCGRCEFPTCLAFAAAVMRGDKQMDLCPHIDSSVLAQFKGRPGPRPGIQEDRDEALRQLRTQIQVVDLAEAAERLGASHSGNILTVKCLGKDFHVDPKGTVRSDRHLTPWLIIPLLNYIIHCVGKEVAGKWVLFNELEGGADWARLFAQRCEKPLKQFIDTHTDLFEDVIAIFGGNPMEDSSSCDFLIVLHPLPRVPVLIRYWRKEGDFDSALTLMFDSTAADNLGVEPLYTICVGIVTMFEKIARTHNFS
jgi:hypothetical protein